MKPITFFRIFNIFIFSFLFLPLIIVIATSFGSSAYLKFPPDGFSLKWYEQVVTDSRYLEPFLNSIFIAIVATFISLIIGTMVSIAVVRYKFKLRESINALFISPLIV